MSNTDLHPEVFFYDFWINLGCIWGAFGVICWVHNASKNYVFFCFLALEFLKNRSKIDKIVSKTVPGRAQGCLRAHLARPGGPRWTQDPFWHHFGLQMAPKWESGGSQNAPKITKNRS